MVVSKKRITGIVLHMLVCCCISLSARQVEVSRPGCRYTVTVPAGWDTIPGDTLKKTFPGLNPDLGMYPASQAEYFAGSYALTGFTPTVHPLVSYTFGRIVSDMEMRNEQTEKAWSNDTIAARLDSIVPVGHDGTYRINQFFTLRKDSVCLKGCQSLYLSKFGYVTCLFYQKGSDALPVGSSPGGFFEPGIIRVSDEYAYIPPQKKGFAWLNLLYSLGIGAIVYGLIVLFSKRKRVGR